MTPGSLHVALTTTRLLVVYQIIFCSCDKSGNTYRYTIILSEPLWIDEALAALGCTSLGSVGDDGLVDTTCDNSTYVYEVRHYAAWTGLLTQVSKLPDLILENVTLFGIGIPVVSSIRAVEREVWFGLLSMVAAIAPSFSALDMSWCTKKSATISSKPLNRVCLSFHLHEAIFVAAAGAALIPWSADKTKAFGVLSDRSVSVENDDVFKAFVSGATFIDPDVVVNRLAIRSTAPPGSLALNRTVQVEVRRLLEIMPVVYIDLADAASIEAALEVVQEVSTLRGTITNAWAILPPGFAVFDDLGAPAERWNRAILNVIGLDIARAVSKVLNLQGLAAGFDVSRHIELTFKDGFAATLWTRGDSPESMWLNKTLGVLSQQEEAATLARQTCGDRTVVDHLQETVVRRLHSWAAPLEETAGTCEVSVNCCDPSAPVELGAVDKLPALTCGKERCESDLEVREHAVCAGFGKHFKTRRCPVAPSISDKHRSLGIGLRVSNIASIDVSKGTFFGDFDIHLYEQNEATTVETSENDDQCNFAGLAHSMDISDANAFWEIFSISGLDAYPILSFQKSTDTEFVKFRGAVFFSTTLHSWPMDVQRMTIDFDTTLDTSFCIMSAFTTITPHVKLAGIKPDEIFDVLALETELLSVCQPPFAFPEHNRCKQYVEGSNSLCEECLDEGHEELPSGHVTCKCMEGSTPKPRASFTVVFTRQLGRLALSVFLPPLAIIVLNQAALYLRVDAGESRMFLSSGSLMGSVMYHINMMSNIPAAAAHLTKADIFMCLCYGSNIAVFLVVLVQYIMDTDEMLSGWVRTSFHNKSRNAGVIFSALTLSFTLVLDEVWQACIVFSLMACFSISATWVDYVRYRRRIELQRR